MPNISFDIFYDQDILNITASRGQVAKIKPAWKVRSAPKLAPKVPLQPPTSVFAPTTRQIQELPDDYDETQSEKPKSEKKSAGKPQKLGKPKASQKAAEKPKDTDKPVEASKPKQAQS